MNIKRRQIKILIMKLQYKQGGKKMKFEKALNEDGIAFAGITQADVIGVPRDQAPYVDWKSGGGPETNMGKRRLNSLKKKGSSIVRRKISSSGDNRISSGKI